jgi:hypothetical protein
MQCLPKQTISRELFEQALTEVTEFSVSSVSSCSIQIGIFRFAFFLFAMSNPRTPVAALCLREAPFTG